MTDQTIAVVIPVYNDQEGISATIESLLTQSTHHDYQVIIVDNDSTDSTPDLIRTYDNDLITLFHETEIQSSYAARNKGIKNTDSSVLAFLDADETVADDWLEIALDAMVEQDVDYLGCNVELELGKDTLVGRYNARTGFPVKEYLEDYHYAPTCALLVRREVFEDVSLFDDRLISGGDVEFGHRVHAAGYDLGYAEEAVVIHPARTSFSSLAKKNFRVGRGFCQSQRYYPDRYGKPRIPPRPTGAGESNVAPRDPLTIRLAFAFLSLAMLAARGLGYYYEFLFGTKRDSALNKA